MRIIRIILLIFVFTVISGVVDAASIEETNSRIDELKAKIAELQQAENSLAKQISLFDTQMSITEVKIRTIQIAVDKLEQEAAELSVEITRLETLLTRRSELVLKRIPESYKRMAIPSFGMVFLSRNFSDFVNRTKYISTVQEEDAQLLFQLKATQNNFAERKGLRETKKAEQEVLRAELVAEQARLEKQKKEKQLLLTQTKNSEAEYQKLLTQALAEKQALERALVEGVKVGEVKKGEPIALVGNTGYPGCSTGKHLHFEIRKGGSWVDPGGFLSSKSVQDEQAGGTNSFGSGGWDWPISDTIRLTQHYGTTPYSWRYSYSGGIHTGYDMVSTSSDVIRAPADGTLYSSSQTCGGSSTIKIKYLEHGDGVISFYLHVQ